MTPRVRAGHLRAQRQLERDYESLKEPTLRSLAGKLRSRSIEVPDADLEAYYNQAWHALFEQLSEGVDIDNTGGFLVQVAYRRAIDDVRRARPFQRDPLEDVEGHGTDDDVLERLDDRRRLREFVEAMRDELDERERTAASLCYLHGYTRPQAAKAMGLSDGRMKKVMDDVSKTVGRFTREIQAGTRCEGRDSGNKAYAIGLLDPEGPRYSAVRAHLDDCSACRADVLRMRGLAAVAPPVLLPWGAALAAGVIAGGGGGNGGGTRSRTTQAAVAGGVAVVVALIVVGLLALTGGDPGKDPIADASPRAVAPAPKTAKASPAKQKPSASKPRGPERKAQSARPAPVARAASSAPPPPPAATPAPAVAPAPSPTTTQPAAPPVDAYQEFGVEP